MKSHKYFNYSCKVILTVLFALAPTHCFALSFTNNAGVVYANVTVMSVTPKDLLIRYSSNGRTSVASVPLKSLPLKVQQQYGYDPQEAEDYSRMSSKRILRVVRHYEIVAQQGKSTVAALPALMSFWGETNWQLVKSSGFTYSERPDKTEITSDDLGQPRRYYQMTWNAPKVDKIAVEQTLDVELTCFHTLNTSAKLPYADGVLKRFSDSLGADKEEKINPDNPDLGPICDPIIKSSRSAEEVVEGVCDWINDNIKFVKGERTSDEALAQRQGSCAPMSSLACSMLRRIGIPAEVADAKFIGSENGHAFIEVYFPDAGWIFYDLSNWNRGYKSLDCLMTVGWAYRSGTPGNTKWTEGYFCVENDTAPYSDQSEMDSRLYRRSPPGKNICGVTVVAAPPPSSTKLRQRPIKELILDTKIPPGQRDYSDNAL